MIKNLYVGVVVLVKLFNPDYKMKMILQAILCVLLETRPYFYIAWELRDKQGCWLVLMFCSNCSVGSKSEMECLLYLFIHLFLQHLLLMRRLMMTNDFTCSEDDAQTYHAYLNRYIWTYQMTQTKLRDILTKLFQLFYLQLALNILLVARVLNIEFEILE